MKLRPGVEVGYAIGPITAKHDVFHETGSTYPNATREGLSGSHGHRGCTKICEDRSSKYMLADRHRDRLIAISAPLPGWSKKVTVGLLRDTSPSLRAIIPLHTHLLTRSIFTHLLSSHLHSPLSDCIALLRRSRASPRNNSKFYSYDVVPLRTVVCNE